jgi:urease accessory protein
VAAVCRAAGRQDWATVREADDLLTAAVAPPSLRAAGREMGTQLLALARTWAWSAAGVREFPSDCHHAVAFGLLGALAGADPSETLAAYLHQALLGMIGAGVRAIPVGHTHGQQVLAYLHGDVEELAADLAGADLDTAGSGCPFYEVLCDEQTRLYSRVFRS